MIERPIDVLHHHPVRKTDNQKSAFADDILGYARRFGYSASVENGKKGVRNVIIGDLQKAKYLITAHYDTPSSIGLPNLIVPNNPFWYITVQFLLVGILLGVSVGVGYLSWLFIRNDLAAFYIGYVVYLIIILLMRFGPANPSNANDNTSGVVTLLEILTVMPEENREQVCFVLFDKEELGLVGSKVFRQSHKEETENLVVLNLDCVGDGDVIQFTPVKNARTNTPLLFGLSRVCGKFESKEIILRDKGFYGGNSDHKSFPNGVAVMAFKQQKGIGLYLNRIHTWRDIKLDYSNVLLLRDAILSLISAPEESVV